MSGGRVRSVNVGRPRSVQRSDGRTVRTSIWKEPVAGRVAIAGTNVAGDEQSDLRVHGGRDKAVYAYAAEDTAWWSTVLGRGLGPGAFGENLTLEGIDVSAALTGERWRVGSALLEVRQPRLPCHKLELRMERPGFITEFIDGGRPGAYLRIVEEGDVEAGDAVTVVARQAEGRSMAQVMATKARRSE